LLSCQLLTDIDHTLRYAKENHDEPFGGINMIFAGDLYQYAPVSGTPLYISVQPKKTESNESLKAKLGRITWQSINAVIELSEQKRMESDPEYASAVLRLRTRQCTFEDACLFNSRVLYSDNQDWGITMDSRHTDISTVILTTNAERELLSAQKANAQVSQPNAYKNQLSLSPVFAATDKIDDNLIVDLTLRKKLLDINVAGNRDDKQLPGFLHLFIGMPVILRKKNISVDLKITNGAQGEVVDILSHSDSCNMECIDLVLVKFKDSPVKLPHLNEGVFPIRPITSTFPVKFGDTVKKISRTQIPLQPAYCVTGHFAQGRTLSAVVVDLRLGSFHAYVAASRPNTRSGLYIMHPVSLEDLNHPLPHELEEDATRLSKLETETLRKFNCQTDQTI
jgi:ATP-dependent exoDNAse (exonuclease V) alpha subunit